MAARTEWDKKRNCIMKAKVIVAFLLSIVTTSVPAFPAVRRKLPNDTPPHVAMLGVSGDNAHVLADLVAIPPAAQFSMDLGAVSNALRTGQITTEQGGYVIGERYQVAMMQFHLFGALHSIVEMDIARTARTPAGSTDPTPSPTGEVVLVAMPFSSLQLSPTLIEYLGLTQTQVKAIQKLMDQQRPKTEPLMLELRTISAKLGIAIEQPRSNDNEGAAQKLAAMQAGLLKQLMIGNSRLQRKVDNVLDPQQRKKLDALKRTGEVTVGEGN